MRLSHSPGIDSSFFRFLSPAFAISGFVLLSFSSGATAQEIAEFEQASVNREFDSSDGWDDVSADSQIISIDGNSVLRLRTFGGWSQFFHVNNRTDYHLVTIQGFRASLDGEPTGWSGFGITYYDSSFNTIDVFEKEILPNDSNKPLSELLYEVSVKIPAGSQYANIWVWNAYDNTETIVDELLVANYFPDNEYAVDDNMPPGLRYRDPHPFGENVIANGTFQASGILDDSTPIQLSRTHFWNVLEPAAESGVEFHDDGLISIGAVSDSTVLWQIVNIVPAQVYNIFTEAIREVVVGEMTFDGRPWAAVGVDYFDNNWNFLGKAELQVNGNRVNAGDPIPSPYPTRSHEIVTPPTARFAVFWIWIEGSGPERFVPLKIKSLSLRRVESNDTEPPTAIPVDVTISGPPASSFFEFTVHYIDNEKMGFSVPGPDIRITGPAAFSQELSAIAGGGNPGELFLVYRFQPPGGSFDTGDNGTYTVTVLADQILDREGNAMPEQVIGTLEVAIP